MNIINLGLYMLTGKSIGKMPVKGCAEVSRQAASEGIVLLKNDGVLPLTENSVALFGCGSSDTSFCGTGSGYTFAPYNISIFQGLKNAGIQISSELWLKNYEIYKKKKEKEGEKLSLLDKRFSGITPYFDVDVISKEELEAASASDTAIYCIKRNTGENFDRKPEKGDYYLSDNEIRNIELLTEHFSQLVVILNTCVIDASYLQSNEKVNGIILLGQAGMEAGNALADILVGKVNPSGRLTDTWASSYDDYPSSKTFSLNDGNSLQEDYLEDIYVGYRHFDTKKVDVVYPFGYGLSYAKFSYDNVTVTADWKEVIIEADVTNTGKREGKDVLQVYVSAPDGKLNKPYQELKGYRKTKLLKAEETERVRITIPTRELCSYDTDTASWIMEKGQYLIRIGSNARDTEIAAAIELDEDAAMIRLSNQVSLDRELTFYEYPRISHEKYTGTVIRLKAEDCVTIDESSKISRTLPVYVNDDYETKESAYHFDVDTAEETVEVKKVENATLLDVADNKITMEEFIATLDDEVLTRLVAGNGQETKYDIEPRLPKGAFKSVFNPSSSGKMTDMFSRTLGIPAASLADGPAGLHLMGELCCGYPVGMVLAQTWNTQLVEEIGDCYGKEMEYYHVAIALAPGMNIHRDPLCGRNFEYYSEDPLISGDFAAAFTRGLQDNHPGYGVTIKHFCCNNQETTRNMSNSSVSERALREIYLKGFEKVVKEARPMTVMSSYNLVNGTHTSSRYDLLTDVLRGEWGFEGMVMTDWDGESDRIADLNAGNDILMGGYPSHMLMTAVGNVRPEFEKDGSVRKKKIALYGGVMHKEIDLYNSFLPDKDGNTFVEVETQQVSDQVRKLAEEGICEIKDDKVIYKGFDRAYSLKRSVLQRNAMRVLNILLGSPMKMSRRK